MNDLEKIKLCSYSLNNFLMNNLHTVSELLFNIAIDDSLSDEVTRAYMLSNGITHAFKADVTDVELRHYKHHEGKLIRAQMQENLIATLEDIVVFMVKELGSFTYGESGQSTGSWYYGGCRHMNNANVKALAAALESDEPMNLIAALRMKVVADAHKVADAQIAPEANYDRHYAPKRIYPYDYNRVNKEDLDVIKRYLNVHIKYGFGTPMNIPPRELLRAVIALVSGSTAMNSDDCASVDVHRSIECIFERQKNVVANPATLLTHPNPGMLTLRDEECVITNGVYENDFYLLRDYMTALKLYSYYENNKNKEMPHEHDHNQIKSSAAKEY